MLGATPGLGTSGRNAKGSETRPPLSSGRQVGPRPAAPLAGSGRGLCVLPELRAQPGAGGPAPIPGRRVRSPTGRGAAAAARRQTSASSRRGIMGARSAALGLLLLVCGPAQVRGAGSQEGCGGPWGAVRRVMRRAPPGTRRAGTRASGRHTGAPPSSPVCSPCGPGDGGHRGLLVGPGCQGLLARGPAVGLVGRSLGGGRGVWPSKAAGRPAGSPGLRGPPGSSPRAGAGGSWGGPVPPRSSGFATLTPLQNEPPTGHGGNQSCFCFHGVLFYFFSISFLD